MSMPSLPTPNGAQLGNGAILTYKISPATVYTAIGDLVDVATSPEFGEVTVPFLSVTAEYTLPTIYKAGEVTAKIAFNGAGADEAALIAAFNAATIVAWQLWLRDGTLLDFTGFLKGMPISGVEQESFVEMELKIRVNAGKITITHP